MNYSQRVNASWDMEVMLWSTKKKKGLNYKLRNRETGLKF